MSIETQIGLRYLRSKRKEAFIAFTTLIAIIGIAIGVMALVVVIAVMTGFQEEIKNRILGISPHVLVLSLDGEIRDPNKVIETIKKEKGITYAFPFLQFQALILSRNQQTGVIVKGVNPEDVPFLARIVRAGSIGSLKTDGNVLVGKELLRQLNLMPEDDFHLMIPSSGISPFGLIPEIYRFKVGGVIETGIFDIDSVIILMSLDAALKLTGMRINGIEVRLEDAYEAERIKQTIVKKLGLPFFARTWIEMNKNLFSALRLEKIAMFIILALIIFVASFNIISSLVMTVMEKKKDIAILKSFGAKKRMIMKIFVIEGMAIGISGAIIGSVFGYILCELIKRYKIVTLPQDIYYITHLPVKIDLTDILLVGSVTLIICALSTIYPSYKAAKVDPVEALRYE
ncbi:MAG: lipoprotein-releasing ABC transporter permease subunit [Desulfobacterota bacterium]|nr:lipoprotein-releasing ABC transporter permease subunit [Thermodesulfobacteriota bacterium]MDW8001609.1 lipoprotein-releasing ABC transporter permease subunit [Deltaproteobacteria bacterium]